jgi:LuxR family maltose regulon positive regulatory protein
MQERYPHYYLVYVDLADVFYQWNDLDHAQRYFSIGHQMAEQGGEPLEIFYARLGLIKLRCAEGDRAGALELFQSLDSLFRQASGLIGIDQVAALYARWQATFGQKAEALAWLENVDLTVGPRLGNRQGTILLNAARVTLGTGKLDEALTLLSKIESAAHNGGSLTWEIEGLVLQGLIWHKKGESARAKSCIEKALSLAEKEGFIRMFLDEGQPMLDILRRSASRFASRLLAAVSTVSAQRIPASALPGLIDPLSERELEVLRLIASGRLNKEIGDQLYIAIGTVKRHTANIFRKLDVINRTQAVARSRELGLL